MKREAFGGDDGADYFEAEIIEKVLAVADHDKVDTVTIGFTPLQPGAGPEGEDIDGQCIFTF